MSKKYPKVNEKIKKKKGCQQVCIRGGSAKDVEVNMNQYENINLLCIIWYM